MKEKKNWIRAGRAVGGRNGLKKLKQAVIKAEQALSGGRAYERFRAGGRFLRQSEKGKGVWEVEKKSVRVQSLH